MTARQNNNFLLKFFSLFVVIYDGGDSYEDPQRVAYAKAEKNKRLFSRPLDRPRAPAMMNLILISTPLPCGSRNEIFKKLINFTLCYIFINTSSFPVSWKQSARLPFRSYSRSSFSVDRQLKKAGPICIGLCYKLSPSAFGCCYSYLHRLSAIASSVPIQFTHNQCV